MPSADAALGISDTRIVSSQKKSVRKRVASALRESKPPWRGELHVKSRDIYADMHGAMSAITYGIVALLSQSALRMPATVIDRRRAAASAAGFALDRGHFDAVNVGVLSGPPGIDHTYSAVV